ncbi:DegT/DnrJ/EryC1/StrS family aminotransferase [Halorientalis marina]|uniref:DegT/DnrJ/EryC1/StrS family aminotransferase n=1 Tax=Halorientalis marina TaxID=2931976 RepID=UPI001FF589BB|nr:DegT/DnrJ/EryC1/StrS family aminotransferase [Halorientalis marina]
MEEPRPSTVTSSDSDRPDRGRRGRTSTGGHRWDTSQRISTGLLSTFEDTLASRFGVEHAITAPPGVDPLELALRSAGVGRDDAVLVSVFAPRATFESIIAVGARPVVVDVNPITYTMATLRLEQLIEATADPAAIVPTHSCGQPAEMHRIRDSARANDLHVIEDARRSIGATYQGESVGTIGDVGCYDLSEPGTSQPCGAVVTDDAELARRCRWTQFSAATGAGKPVASDGTAAARTATTGLERLSGLETRIEHRQELADAYTRRLSDITPVRPPQRRRDTEHVFTTYALWVPDLPAVRASLVDNGFDIRLPFQYLYHRHPSRSAQVASDTTRQRAEELADHLLALPVSSATGATTVRNICLTIEVHYRRRLLRDRHDGTTE